MSKNKSSTLTIKQALKIKIWEHLAKAQNHTLTSIQNNDTQDITSDTDTIAQIQGHIEAANTHLQDIRTNHT